MRDNHGAWDPPSPEPWCAFIGGLPGLQNAPAAFESFTIYASLIHFNLDAVEKDAVSSIAVDINVRDAGRGNICVYDVPLI